MAHCIYGLLAIQSSGFELVIYDRWGMTVWSTDKYSEDLEMTEGWDGRSKNGKIVPVGVYTWFVRFKDFKGRVHEKTGAVTVVK